VAKERRSEAELRQMMLAAARKHEECSELEDLFIFGPTPRPDANWGFGIAGKDNKVSVACYTRLNQIAGALQKNMNCTRSRRPDARSKREFGPSSMTTRRLRPRCRTPVAPTSSPHSRN
jgi:hypothetical protein